MAGFASLMMMAAGALPPAPPPPITTIQVPAASPVGARGLLTWTPGDVRCEGGSAPSARRLEKPLAILTYLPRPQLAPIIVSFAIDAEGRTHSIKRGEQADPFRSADVAPSLAATRFAAGRPLADCSVAYTPSFSPMAEAPVAELLAYSVNPQSGPLARDAWMRIVAGTDCSGDKRLQPLLRAYPNFGAVSGTPGVRDWSMVRFDTDAAGVPINAEVRTGSGNAALDRAAVEAVLKSRFTPGERRGCHYPYWKSPPSLAAPLSPPDLEKREACEETAVWEVKPALVYPPEYRRRAIEGWAAVRYDIAPWGAIGNVTVLSAQPSADFGLQAKTMMERAKAMPSAAGVQGCSVLVRYAMSKDDYGASPPPPVVD